MKHINMTYEIETRVFFKSEKEAYDKLPFLRNLLTYSVNWETSTHSMKMFSEDKMFRFSKVWNSEGTRYYLGYKEPDIGKNCNIRAEIDEDISNGFEGSIILDMLGIEVSAGEPHLFPKSVGEAGYPEFMSFKGHSLMGRDSEWKLSFKLMFCDDLEYPILFEIEKTTESIDDVYLKETEILTFIRENNLTERIVKEEPTTLLYKKKVLGSKHE